MDNYVKWLQKMLPSIFKIRSWNGVTCKPLDDANGYMAEIYQVRPKWEGENLPDTLIMKIPNFLASSALSSICPELPGEEERETSEIKSFHISEIYFYDLFMKYDPPPIAIPHIYYTRSEGGDEPDQFPVILMEDLTAYTVVDLVEGLNEKQLYATADELAKLHFYSLTNDEWKHNVPSMEDRKHLGSFPKMVFHFAMILKKQKPEYFGQIEDLLQLLGEKDWNDIYLDACKADKMTSVIAHGDLWAANLMWNGDKIKAIIDWQMAHCGSLTEDIMRILVTGATIKSRRTLTEKILDHYYETIKKLFEDRNLKVPFGSAELHDTYRKMLPHGAAQAVFAVGVWSNTLVLQDGSSNEEVRIRELHDRLKDFLDETFEHHKPTNT